MDMIASFFFFDLKLGSLKIEIGKFYNPIFLDTFDILNQFILLSFANFVCIDVDRMYN